MLTDVELVALMSSPPARRTEIADGATPGLSARITSNGFVSWSLRFRATGEAGHLVGERLGKRLGHRISLGSYPKVTIRDARKCAAAILSDASLTIEDARKRAAQFRHPTERYQSSRKRSALDRYATVALLVEEFIAEYAQPNIRSWKNGLSFFDNHLIPRWGQLLVQSIDGRDAARLLSDVAKGPLDPDSGKQVPRPGAAREVRKWGLQLFSWAVQNGLAASNPFAETEARKQKSRQRILDMTEARALWQAASEMEYPWRELLQVLLVSACRLREIAPARWDWVNIADARILIPAAMYNNQQPFLIALPPLGLDILKGIPRWPKGDHVFSTENGAYPVSRIPAKRFNALHGRVEEIVGRTVDHFVINDLRRTIQTRLSGLNVSEAVVDQVLGPARGNSASANNVHGFESEKREALTLWADELTRT